MNKTNVQQITARDPSGCAAPLRWEESMRFGVFYELQLPKPWNPGDEHRLFKEALEKIILADRLGYEFAWEVEHHFLEEYSHSSCPEVFLAAAAAGTANIRLGHGIRQVIANNHPKSAAPITAPPKRQWPR
jgi:hypothetical protein